MTVPELLARLDAEARPILVRFLPARATIAYYSWARQVALRLLTESKCPTAVVPPEFAAIVLWGIRFRAPLFNAAGMFKHGEGYELAYRQGAGAYLAGTTTSLPRMGNVRHGIALPFVPYPQSKAASNWLGLPNPGHRAVASRIARLPRYPGFPIGASVALDPGMETHEAIERLLEGMELYRQAGVDFLELNESCPNTGEDVAGLEALLERLRFIASHFVRPHGVPTLVKLSVDSDPHAVEHLARELSSLGYGGLVIGNTSTQYAKRRTMIVEGERRTFDYFTGTFGGGISGEPLREDVRRLIERATRAVEHRSGEFHLIAVGGIASGDDLRQAFAAGARLAEWYTGYFERFARDGHLLYARVFAEAGA